MNNGTFRFDETYEESFFGCKKTSTPRPFTDEEVTEKFLTHIWGLIHYWENESRQPKVHEKLTGLAFSILSAIDGCNASLPGFSLIPAPHKDDEQYRKERGYNWYPYSGELKHDIGGSLHDQLYKFEPK
jgi:hypothetical protein